MDASCSGSTPFKNLLEHNGTDRESRQSRLSSPSGVSSTFRTAPINTNVQDAYSSFISGAGGLPPVDLGPAIHSLPPNPNNVYRAPFSGHVPFTAAPSVGSQPQPQTFKQLDSEPLTSPPSMRTADDVTRTTLTSQHPRGSLQYGDASNSPWSIRMQPNQGPVPFIPTTQHSEPSLLQHIYQPEHTNIGFINVSARAAQQPDINPGFGREVKQVIGLQSVSQFREDVDAILEEIAAELETVGMQEAQAMVHTETSSQHGQENLPQVEGGDKLEPAIDEPLCPVASQTEVSAVARKILESVSHEDDDKWRNSNFLALMRDFRDGKKTVINDEIRPVT